MRSPALALWVFLLLLQPCFPAMAVEEGGVRLGGKASENTATPRLEELMRAKRADRGKNAANRATARARVLEDAAKTLGFQEGFKWHHEILMQSTEVRSAEFDRIFDFRRLLIDDRVLPPVIRWTGPSMSLESDSYATEVEAQYRIVSPARIVSSAPTWRSYLEVETEVLKPADEILPADSTESAIWRENLLKGWSEGVQHAETVFELSMNKLVSDFRGILRFKMLADKGLVSVPILAKGDLGIQVGKNVLNLEQKTFRITVPAEFKKMEK